MTLGLGTGSTAGWFVRLLSERIRSDRARVTGVATSSATVWLAEELGVPLRKLDDVERDRPDRRRRRRDRRASST